MPWNKEHKQSTRRRIVEAAAAALRARGLEGVGVGEIMKQAGLTHGGFYAHFPSKDALVAEALAQAADQTGAWLRRAAGAAIEGDALLAVADTYLSPPHREHPERGCPVAALGAEVVRDGGEAHVALEAGIRARLARLKEIAAGPGEADRERQAIGTLAAMVGGMILARAMSDRHEGDQTLATVRQFLRQALAARDESGGGPSPRRAGSLQKAKPKRG